MIENIKLNKLEDKIIPINAAVSYKEGLIKVPLRISLEESGCFQVKENSNGDAKIPVYSLENILKFVNDPYLLKMDCEGCEINLILKNNSIKNFEKLVFEYHCNKNWKLKFLIIKKLNKLGFVCQEKIFKFGQGIIYCEKR